MAYVTNLHKDGPVNGYVTVFADAKAGFEDTSWNAGDCCGSTVKT